MRTYYILVVSVILGVFTLLLYPSIHLWVSTVDTTGFLPLLKMAVVLLPYVFLGIAVYAIIKLSGK